MKKFFSKCHFSNELKLFFLRRETCVEEEEEKMKSWCSVNGDFLRNYYYILNLVVHCVNEA
jgi:hypothetical protein